VRKNLLITGAARRIGAACARLLHSQGCNIAVHYHTSEVAAVALCAELNAARAHSAVAVQADLANLQALQHLAATASNYWGGLDALINNASQFMSGNIDEVTESVWDNIFASNLKAPFFLAQQLAETLAARRGCIVNIVDIYAERSLPGYPVYSISKAGLLAMTKCLAKELAPEIRVNAVAPGAILWPEQGMDEAAQKLLLQRIALQRCGEVNDIAEAVAFLIHRAKYITGQTITVDGGRSLFI